MRLPFLQVDWDFLSTSAGDLAELLRTSEAEAGWAMVRLWGWCITKASTPDALGVLAGEDMQRLAERAAGWKGEPGAFLTALCGPAVALAQRREDGTIRLSGMERYAATYRKQESDRARKSRGSRAEVAATAPGIPPEVARKTQTQTQTQREEKKIPPTPQGAREPREGEPCEEHHPPRTAPPAAREALESFAAAPPPPKPGEWTIPDAVDAVHRVVYDGRPYGWVESLDGPAALVLRGYCDAEGVPPERQAEEIGRRLGRAMARFHQQFAPGVGKSQTLKRLANRDCWKANAEPPTREEPSRDRLTGVAKPVVRVLEPWAQVDPSRRAA